MEVLFRKLDLIEDEIDRLRPEERASRELKLSIVESIKRLIKEAREEARKSCIVPETSSTVSYAEKVKGKKSIPGDNMLLVYPKEEIDCKQTRNLLRLKVRPENKGMGINQIRNVRNGGLLIEARGKQDAAMLLEELSKESKHFEVKKPKMRNPHVILYNIEKECDLKELASIMEKQNDLRVEGGNIKYKFSTKTKSVFSYNAVLEVSPNIYKQLMARGQVYIGMSRCQVKTFTLVTRCFRCQRYGHISKFCTNEKEVCGLCAKEHSTKECVESEGKNSKCVNCERANNRNGAVKRDSNHTSFDRNCPTYKGSMTFIDERTDYGQ